MADNQAVLLSVIVPSLTGEIPRSIPDDGSVEVVAVKGVSPVSAARNEGLARVAGDYVAWADSDDEVSENWLSNVLQGLDGRPDVLSFNARVEWVDGKRPSYRVGGPAYAADVMAERTNGQLWNKVIRRELFNGLSFHGVAHEDYRLLCELLPRAKTFRHIDKDLYVYRRSVNGLSQHTDVDSARNAILGLIEFLDASSDVWKPEITKGVAQRVADFCRNAESSPDLRRFIRSALPLVLLDRSLSARTKAKCLLAGIGI